MKLQEIFDQLSTNELSQLAIGGQPAGVINSHNYKQILNHINLALTTLYRRFHLKEGQIQVALQPDTSVYVLKSDYAVSAQRSKQAVRYIVDSTAAPFHDDVIKIKRVLTDLGYEMPLNNVDNPISCLTPSLTTLAVPDVLLHPTSKTPKELITSHLGVTYQAAHPVLTLPLGLFDPHRVEIELPYSHLQALLYFVASRVNNPVGMGQEFNAGNNYAARFEAECKGLEAANIEIDQSSQPNRLRRHGFV